MNTELEIALKNLEQSTEALLRADMQDVMAVCRALERRANAITEVASIVEDARGERSAFDRVSAALASGDEAARRALGMKRDATEEWMRLHRVLDGLDKTMDVTPPVVDCSA